MYHDQKMKENAKVCSKVSIIFHMLEKTLKRVLKSYNIGKIYTICQKHAKVCSIDSIKKH